MRTLVGLVAAVLVGLAVFTYAQGVGEPKSVLIAPNEERVVTLSKGGIVVVSITVPQGTAMVVTYEPHKGMLPAGNGRFDFFGNVEIRAAQAAIGPTPTQGTIAIEQIRQSAPILLTGKDVDVTIAPTRAR